MVFPLIIAIIGFRFDGVSVFPAEQPFHIRGAADLLSGAGTVGGGTVSVSRKGATPYECELTSPVSTIEIKKGDTLFVSYEARCTLSSNESKTGTWNVRAQRPEAPYDGPYDGSGNAGSDWRSFSGAFRADKDYPVGKMVLTFHLAIQKQNLEFRNLSWKNFGPNVDPNGFPVTKLTYGGQDTKAPWRAQAAAMIEKNRKANLTIQAKPGATIHVKMLRHDYPFGTVTGVDPKRDDDDAKKFFAFMKANYSRLTTPIYWTDWGWEDPKTRQKYLDNINWCLANGYRIKGHNIIWPSNQWMPKRTIGLSKEKLSKEITKALGERLDSLRSIPFENIDVVNELVSEHDVEDKLGLGFAVEAFKRCHEIWPNADLVYNDYLVQDGDGVNPKFLGYAKKLKGLGAPITMLGLQAHYGEALPPISWYWKMLDLTKAETGLPVEITEYDLNTRDDQTQGEYTRDIVTAWFAHPQSKGFTMWGFWEGDHWIPPSAMIRKDWTMRPQAKVWHELVTKTWWTDVTIKADSKGLATVRGFKGDYEISSGALRKMVKLREAKNVTFVK